MHKDLDIWKLGIELVEKIYKITNSFPESERFGLISQMQRASVSYPSNIAEGAARNSIKEYIRFIYISLGSLAELETQIIIAEKLGYINDPSIFENIEKIRRKHLNFIKYMKNKTA
ncbi:MAG: four helix bundle protein [Candidatus Tenebribacter davisii]|nr:four helix bundle protein [Candidatus Tenebribacter davisii]